jgi:Zn-dependent protease with chaperone function
MTALIGGSVLLIVIASVTLVLGWAGTNEPLIYTSITSSVASFVCLALAYYRSKSEARRVVAAAHAAESPEEQAPDASETAEPGESLDEPEAAGELPIDSTQPVPQVNAQENADVVVAFPQRRKYHRPSCRYASAQGGERVSKEAAVGRGYDACRLCKP